MSNIPLPYKHFLKGWLKSGAVHHGIYLDTESGTPQGGIISPDLANYTLAGLEEEVLKAIPPRVYSDKLRYPNGKKKVFYTKVNIVRYADDFVITTRNRHDAKCIMKVVDQFLGIRGLRLNLNKTKVISIYEGFEFLGFNYKHYRNKKLVMRPSSEAVQRIKTRIREIIKDPRIITGGQLIMKLNQVLRG